MTDDPRVTRAGKTLRRFSLDELPQLLNVLNGDMSLVGPRPQVQNEVGLYTWPTAPAPRQAGPDGPVAGQRPVGPSYEESERLDLYYVENWSLATDLMILWRTFRAVVKSSGAYRHDPDPRRSPLRRRRRRSNRGRGRRGVLQPAARARRPCCRPCGPARPAGPRREQRHPASRRRAHDAADDPRRTAELGCRRPRARRVSARLDATTSGGCGPTGPAARSRCGPAPCGPGSRCRWRSTPRCPWATPLGVGSRCP